MLTVIATHRNLDIYGHSVLVVSDADSVSRLKAVQRKIKEKYPDMKNTPIYEFIGIRDGLDKVILKIDKLTKTGAMIKTVPGTVYSLSLGVELNKSHTGKEYLIMRAHKINELSRTSSEAIDITDGLLD